MFYISSEGHSATGWLSKLLSTHPKIICFHGTRSIPPYGSGINDMNVKDFINGLKECEKNVSYKKIFGACHGYYGTLAKNEIERNNGKYLAIIRNPIKRIESIFNAFNASFLSFDLLSSDEKLNTDFTNKILLNINSGKKIYKDFYYIKNQNLHKSEISKFKRIIRGSTTRIKKIKRLFLANRNNIIIKNSNDGVIIEGIPIEILSCQMIYSFSNAVNRCLSSDEDNYLKCNENQLIQMEKFTTNLDYFKKNILNKILGENASTYLDTDFFNTDHVNYHTSNNSVDPYEIYNNWPDLFKEMLYESLKNKDVNNIYNKFDYKIDTFLK